MAKMQLKPTAIDSLNKIKNLLSPLYVETTNANPFTHVQLKIWVWDTNLDTPWNNNDDPTIILFQEKVSPTDNYILFEISDYIRYYSKPSMLYNKLGITFNTGQVFFQYEATYINNPLNLPSPSGFFTKTYPTQLGLHGYNYDFQGTNAFNPDTSFNKRNGGGLTGGDYWYIADANYYDVKFNFDSSVTRACSSYIGYTQLFMEPNYCPKEKIVIYYINAAGLWDYFTPVGKVVISEKIKRENYKTTTRRPDLVNTSSTHRVKSIGMEVEQEWEINTGFLIEREAQIIEIIRLSPLVYVIEIKDDLIPNGVGGLTPGVVTRQIPVVNTDSDFIRKTRINNKGKINYTMKFIETSNKILSNR